METFQTIMIQTCRKILRYIILYDNWHPFDNIFSKSSHFSFVMLLSFVHSFKITQEPIDSIEIQSSIKFEVFNRVQIMLIARNDWIDFVKRMVGFTDFYIKRNHLSVLDVLLLPDSINVFHHISHLFNNVFLMHLMYFKKSLMVLRHFSFHLSVFFFHSAEAILLSINSGIELLDIMA